VPHRTSRVGVLIMEVSDGNALLPYPVKGLSRLRDAIDENILWDSADLHLQADLTDVDPTPYFDAILQKSMLRPTSVESHDGDIVKLIILGCKVADTIIHHVDDARSCHQAIFGLDKVSVRITKF
jgi:hypothetical protein